MSERPIVKVVTVTELLRQKASKKLLIPTAGEIHHYGKKQGGKDGR